MKDILSRLADAPVPPATAAVIGIILLILVWKLVKGMIKTVLMLAIIAAVFAVLVWMGKVDRPTF